MIAGRDDVSITYDALQSSNQDVPPNYPSIIVVDADRNAFD